MVDDIESIADSCIDADAVDANLASDVTWDSVPQSDILHAQVGHVNKVAGLWIEVELTSRQDCACGITLTSATVPQAWELGILTDSAGIKLSLGDIVGLVSIESISTTHHWHYEGTLSPHLALAHALQIEVEVEALPVAAQAQ